MEKSDTSDVVSPHTEHIGMEGETQGIETS